MNVLLRAARATDSGFVCSTWVKSQREHGDLVDQVLDRKTARLLIAHPAGDADRILGWLCYERQPRALLVHMAYVRPKERRKGLMTRMITEAKQHRTMALVVTASQPPVWSDTLTRLPIRELLAI